MTHGPALTMGSAESLGLACSAEKCQGWGSFPAPPPGAPHQKTLAGVGESPLLTAEGSRPQLLGAGACLLGPQALEEVCGVRSALLCQGRLPQQGPPAWVPPVSRTLLPVSPDWNIPCIIKAGTVSGLSTVSLEV